MSLRGERVLVTGGGGFIGSRLIKRLTAHNKVKTLDHFQTTDPKQLPTDVEIIRSDVNNQTALRSGLRDTTVVFHQAGVSGTSACEANLFRSHETNTTGTLRLLEECTNHELTVIVASSASVYGSQPSGPIPETAETRPTNNYGVQKLLAEQYADTYFQESDLDIRILRYFNVFGTQEVTNDYHGLPGKFLDCALSEQKLTLAGDGSQTRDFVHVSDVVDANVGAAAHGSPGSVYNIGSGKATSIRELAAIVTKQVSKDVTIETDQTISTGVSHSHADISRAKKELGFSPNTSIKALLEPIRTQIQSM